MSDNSNTKWVSNWQSSPACEIKFKKTNDDAILPRKAHPDSKTGDTGYDLFAVEDTSIPAKGSAVVPVGITLTASSTLAAAPMDLTIKFRTMLRFLLQTIVRLDQFN